jgi:capsular polysaccharide export protein
MPLAHGFKDAQKDDWVVGWGMKDNTEKARSFAENKGLPYLHLEDGFLSFMAHPAIDNRRLSLIGDRTGIYYDATKPSDLEAILNSDRCADPALKERAEDIIEAIRRWRLSKYNHADFYLSEELAAKLLEDKREKVLVVDQTAGDKSIELGLAKAETFQKMLDTALEENPNALVIVKTHPDVRLSKKKGHFNPRKKRDRVLYVSEDCNPQALIAAASRVYVVTSQMGAEALIAGKPVTCFGMPFYAGWGLTTDKVLCLRRRAKRTLEELVAAAFILYPRYVDPYTNERVQAADIVGLLATEKQIVRPRAKRVVAVGFSLWKRGFVSKFLGPNVKSINYISEKTLSRFLFRDDDIIVAWGRKHEKELQTIKKDVPIWRMEDGFLRSVGLGSDLKRPASLVLDSAGIYYDYTCTNDLERFLRRHEFSEHELERGRKLKESLVGARLSKYNVGEKGKLDFRARAKGKKIILIPGQVEGDASLDYGAPRVNTNAALIKAAYGLEHDGYFVYKPHPDVVSGNRKGEVPEKVMNICVDEVVTDADIIDCLDAVDAVHTMTSLTGFEALMRGLHVTVHGVPFYAGWGLTRDRVTPQQRGRRLTVDALVYAVFCVYARYADWDKRGAPTSPEALIARMSEEAGEGGKIKRRGKYAAIERFGIKMKYLFEGIRG